MQRKGLLLRTNPTLECCPVPGAVVEAATFIIRKKVPGWQKLAMTF